MIRENDKDNEEKKKERIEKQEKIDTYSFISSCLQNKESINLKNFYLTFFQDELQLFNFNKSIHFKFVWDLFVRYIKDEALLNLTIDGLDPETPCLSSNKLKISKKLIHTLNETDTKMNHLYNLLSDQKKEEEENKNENKNLIYWKNVSAFILDVIQEMNEFRNKTDFDILIRASPDLQKLLHTAGFNPSQYGHFCFIYL